MGWGSGIVDGREVGYAVEALCEHAGCHQLIDRGLGYACGSEHGDSDFHCGRYYCADHLTYVENPLRAGAGVQVCAGCAAEMVECATCGAEHPLHSFGWRHTDTGSAYLCPGCQRSNDDLGLHPRSSDWSCDGCEPPHTTPP